jgi:hypothetical protein
MAPSPPLRPFAQPQQPRGVTASDAIVCGASSALRWAVRAAATASTAQHPAHANSHVRGPQLR